jgi:hypothetical protein
MDGLDHEWRSRYRMCRAGFALLALGLGLLCLADVVHLLDAFDLAPELVRAQGTPTWFWLVNAPIPWTTLIGAMLLLGQWKLPFWQGRVLLLVAMNGVDALTWTLTHARQLGLDPGFRLGPYRWLIHLVTMGFGWFELLLTASLAAAVCAHLGNETARRRHQTAQMIGTIGVALWFIYTLTQTQWAAWPPMPNVPDPAGILVLLVSTFLRALACFQIALLGMTASRQCRQYLAEWDVHEGAGAYSRKPEPDRDEIDLFRR